MRVLRSILVGLMVTSASLLCFARGGWQQHKNDPPQNGRPQYHLNGPGPHRGDWLRQNGNLPLQQQEQQLRQDPRFRNLSPAQQQKLIDRLHNFDNLTPDDKAKVLNRMEMFEHLTPSQQQAAQGMFQRYKALPEDRQSRVRQAYHQLQNLSPEQRNQLLNSPGYRSTFTEDERDLLRGMTDLTAQNR